MELTKKEKFQIQYLLPVKGCLRILEQAEDILNRINIKANDETSEEIESVNLTNEDIKFLCDMIHILDKAQLLNLHSLSLIRKILKSKEKYNG